MSGFWDGQATEIDASAAKMARSVYPYDSSPDYDSAKRWVLREAVRAAGNWQLACQEDREDRLALMRTQARNVELYDHLVSLDACIGGLYEVGRFARTWRHLGVLIAQCNDDGPDSGDASGYLEWCDDNLDRHTCEEVRAGYAYYSE